MDKYCPRCFKYYDSDVDRCPVDGSNLVGRLDKNLVGQELDGRYRVIRQIGRGGMGVVYEAQQESLSRRVAVKVLPGVYLSSPKSLKRFRREARAAARLHHTNIVPIFGVGQQDGDGGRLVFVGPLVSAQHGSSPQALPPIELLRGGQSFLDRFPNELPRFIPGETNLFRFGFPLLDIFENHRQVFERSFQLVEYGHIGRSVGFKPGETRFALVKQGDHVVRQAQNR